MKRLLWAMAAALAWHLPPRAMRRRSLRRIMLEMYPHRAHDMRARQIYNRAEDLLRRLQ